MATAVLDTHVQPVQHRIDLDVVRCQIRSGVDDLDDHRDSRVDDAHLVTGVLRLTVAAGAVGVGQVEQPAVRVPRELVRLGDQSVDPADGLQRHGVVEIEVPERGRNGQHLAHGTRSASPVAGSANPTVNR